MTTVFDIETDGLLPDLTKIHCISISVDEELPICYSGSDIEEIAIPILNDADVLVGHNIIGFDIPALKKLTSFQGNHDQQVRDTYLLSQMLWPDIRSKDSEKRTIPKKHWGSYSLRSFGFRMGILKSEMEEFTEFNLEMAMYCDQDVVVTSALWRLCLKRGVSLKAVDLETGFAFMAQQMEDDGIAFDVGSALALSIDLDREREDLLTTLSNLIPPEIEEMRTPQYWVDPLTDVKYEKKSAAPPSVRKDLRRGPNKIKEHPFNPMSRQQVADFLISKGWEPEDYTPTGIPKVDETILLSIKDIPQAEQIARLYRLQKLLGMLSDGKESWLNLVRDGRLHPRIKSLGTVSGRTSCVKPNLQQVPSARLPYGAECRKLFKAPPGHKLIGVDAKSLEVRCFAHYMAAFDNGEFADEVMSGDMHAANAELMKCDRQVAKNTFFALLYGASPTKIASMLDCTVRDARKLLDELFQGRPAMRRLMDLVKSRAESRGHLIGLDGRKLFPRSVHSSVNLLIQAAGACVSKQASLNIWRDLRPSSLGLPRPSGKGVGRIVGFIHDELILEVPQEYAEMVLKNAIECFHETTYQIHLKCDMEGDGLIGDTWYDIH